MEETHYSVHYKTLTGCAIQLTVQQEHAAYVELLEGYAQVKQDRTINNLPQRERYELQSLNSFLYSNDGCCFKVHGRHEITWSEGLVKEVPTEMFKLFQSNSNLQICIGKMFQLLVFHREHHKRITLEIVRGTPRFLGSVFSATRGYYLPAYTPVRIQNDKNVKHPYCAIEISEPTGLFDFFISPIEAEVWDVMKKIQAKFYARSYYARENKASSPKILVLGNRNITKISFCHFLLDRALDNCLFPVYADLNVRENSTGIPGSVRIVPIVYRRSLYQGRCHVSNLFLGDEDNIFSFGYVNPESNIKLYYQLLKGIGVLSNEIDSKYIARNGGTLIDMCDVLSKNFTAIKYVIGMFDVKLIAVIGDTELYERLQTWVGKDTFLRFIPHQEYFEPLNYNLHNGTLRDYFLQNQNVFPTKFSDIEICEIMCEGATDTVDHNTDIHPEEFQAVRVACDKHLENHVLGVSQCSTMDQHLSVTRVKYFVLIMCVDMVNEILSIMSPKADSLIGAILIKGDIKCETQNMV